MPELPEVEIIKRGLEKCVVGFLVGDVEIRLAKMLEGDVKNVVGARIVGVRRFGKGLVVDFDNTYSLAIHLKMTGQLVYAEGAAGLNFMNSSRYYKSKHTHVVFKLKGKGKKSNSAFLFYNDIRQFGWIRVVRTSGVGSLGFFKNLGCEPLKDMTLEKFLGIIKDAKMPIKNLLLDQRRIAGLGNIYVNDALFVAGIDPRRKALSIDYDEGSRLFVAIEVVLKKGIAAGGASEWNYVNVMGEKGGYQKFFQVYRKEGEECSRCEEIIRKIVMGGRGTFYCPGCQV